MRVLLCALGAFLFAVTGAQGQDPVKVDMREVRDHQIGPRPMIHSKDYSPTKPLEAVQLEVTVDPAGNIESVKALNGPPEFFGLAGNLVAKRKFKPFLRDGNPVRASFTDYVSIVPPEEWAETTIPFPEIKDWTTLKMRLQRTQCYGSCPAYSVLVSGDGSVDFNGTFNVLLKGHHRATLPKQAVESLLAAFRQANYFSLRNSYHWAATDLPTYETSIEFDGQSKSVHDYMGSQVGMPDVVRDLEEAFDRIAGTEKWIKGNQETGAALLAENWDFKADTDENKILFANAVSSGNAELIRLFISKGAPALSMTKDGQSPLLSAAEKGNFDLVKLMLADHPTPPKDVLTCALGAAARSGNLELTRFLLAKGGQPNGPACGEYEKITVLMNAVASHNAEIVKEILGYHPDINATTAPSGFNVMTYFLSRTPAQFNTEKILTLLISAGANVDSLDRQEQTPVFSACQNQHPEAVRLLSAAGADLNVKNRNGQTVLMSCFGNAGLKAVIDAGADLTIKDPRGQTAAEAARSMGILDKAELLETAMKQRKAQ